MAVTRMTSIHGPAGEIVRYIRNPSKTALDAVSADGRIEDQDSSREDRVFLVTGLRCSVERATEEMDAVRKHFGRSGTVSVYHVMQSFRYDEVEPRTAHELGIETANRLWTDRYQVLIATHMNTDSVHNHFVINAWSYVDGRKYRVTKKEFYRFRETSDTICRENSLHVIKDPIQLSGLRTLHYVHEAGQITPLDIVKSECSLALKASNSIEAFERNLERIGYELLWKDFSIRIEGVETPVFMERLGFRSTNEIQAVVDKNMRLRGYRDAQELNDARIRLYEYLKCPSFPRLDWGSQAERLPRDFADETLPRIFEVTIDTIRETLDTEEYGVMRPLTPELRMEAAHLDRIERCRDLLYMEGIRTPDELKSWIGTRTSKIDGYQKERRKLHDRCRRNRSLSPGEKRVLKERANRITALLRDLRSELKTARTALEMVPDLVRKLNREREAALPYLNRMLARARSRSDDLSR